MITQTVKILYLTELRVQFCMKFAKASKVDISLSVFYYKNYQKEVSYNFQNLKTLEKLLSVIWTQCFIWQYQW